MRLHRFYTTEDIGTKTKLTIDSAELANQIRRVFRLKTGDSVILFNGTGFDYECKIDGFGESTIISTDSAISFSITGSQPSRYMPQRKIYLCAALVKKDTFEWITEKATELGVTDIIPIAAERSEKKALNEERLRKIAIEASEQSGRGATPMMHQIMGLGDAAAFLKKENKDIEMIAFHTEGERYVQAEVGSNNNPLAVFIGPEGGWSEAEIELFHTNKIPVRCLGPQVLRTETAVVAALSMAVFTK